MDAAVVLQIPVDARGDVHPRVAPDDGLSAPLVQFEVVEVVPPFLFDDELLACPLVDALQQAVDGRGGAEGGGGREEREAENEEECDAFHGVGFCFICCNISKKVWNRQTFHCDFSLEYLAPMMKKLYNLFLVQAFRDV